MPRPKKTPENQSENGQANAPRVSVVALSELYPDQANVRKHGPRNLQTIGASLHQFGAGRSIVIDGQNIIRAGNGTVEAAAEEGISEVLIVEPGPGQIVAVRRHEWSATEATAYAIADNRSSDLGEFDDSKLSDVLMALGQEDFDIESLGFDSDDMNQLLSAVRGPDGNDGSANRDTGDKYKETGDKPDSTIRTIILTYTVEIMAEFERIAAELGKQYSLASVSDVVLECLREAAAAPK